MTRQRDLFDLGADSAPGERQTDLEDLIEEKSLAQLVLDGDEDGTEEWCERARKGEILRIV